MRALRSHLARAAAFAGSALAALLLAAPTSCVLLIDTLDVEETCGLAGSTSCATCMRKSCQTPIDACCSSSSCAGFAGLFVLEDVDACGMGDKARCAATLDATPSFDKTTNELRACIKASCSTPCTGATP